MSSPALEQFAPNGPPAGWRKVSIGEALAEVDEPIEMRDDVAYDLVSVRRRFGGMFHRERLYGRQILTKTLRRAVPGTFVIARMQIVHGACTYVTPDFTGAAISKSYSSFGSTPHCDARYFSLLAEQPLMSAYFRDASQGVVIEKMTFQQARWLEFPVYLPPLEEQRRIAEVLDTIDETIQATERAVGKLQVVVDAVVVQALQNAGGECRNLTSLGSSDRPAVRSGPFGSMLKGEHWVETGVPVVTIGSLGDSAFDDSEFLYVDDRTAEALRGYELRAGDIVFSRVADVGRALVVPESSRGWIMSSNLIRLSLDRSVVNPLFLWLALTRHRSVRAQIRREVNSSGRDVASSPLLRRLSVPIPAMNVQDEVVRTYVAGQARVDAERKILAKLRDARAGLAASLLSGRVRTVAA